MGLTADDTNNELILFQKFQDSTQLLNSWLSMSFDTSAQTFKKVEDRVISFRNKLTAVYQKKIISTAFYLQVLEIQTAF